MAPQPHRAISFHRHLVLLFAVAAVVGTRAERAAASAPSPDETQSTAPASFLRPRCDTTLYPALCYDSLLPYAGEFRTSDARLARVAADVAAARLRALLARVQDLLHHAPRTGTSAGGGGGGPNEADALNDCASTISAAANLARQSSAELAALDDDAAAGSSSTASAAPGGSSSRRARWGVSNAKTWLSAAITNEGTCADGIEEAGARESPSGKEVDDGVASVKQHTSIALALVNGIPL